VHTSHENRPESHAERQTAPDAGNTQGGASQAASGPLNGSPRRDTRTRLSPEDRNAARRWITRRYTGSDRDQLLAMLGLDDTQEDPR